MPPFDPLVAHRINSVFGWIELGSPTEAKKEFSTLPLEVQNCAELLEVRWIIEARLGSWPDALSTAEQLLAAQPENATGWLHRAYALRRVPNGGVAQAREALLPAFTKFPKDAVIPYNLACYACQLGQLDEARAWLDDALKRGDPKEIRSMALKDPDLEPLRAELTRA